jgi:hypothetical protein
MNIRYTNVPLVWLCLYSACLRLPSTLRRDLKASGRSLKTKRTCYLYYNVAPVPGLNHPRSPIKACGLSDRSSDHATSRHEREKNLGNAADHSNIDLWSPWHCKSAGRDKIIYAHLDRFVISRPTLCTVSSPIHHYIHTLHVALISYDNSFITDHLVNSCNQCHRTRTPPYYRHYSYS